MNKWNKIRAEEFCSSITDGTHDSPKPQSDGKKLITSKHLKEFRLDFDSANYISEKDYQKIIKRSSVEQWDILFSMIGTIGNIYLEKNKTINYACKNVGIFKFAGNKENAYWMYYYLKSPMTMTYINSLLRGSTQSYIPLESLRDLPVLVPDDYSKRKVINILKSLDEKIELNLKINDNLAEQLQLVYQHLIDVSKTTASPCALKDISPPCALKDISQFSTAKRSVTSISLDTYYSTENMLPDKKGATIATSLPQVEQVTACNSGDTLVSNIRPYFKKIVYCTEAGGCSADVLCLTPKKSEYSAFLYSLLYDDHFFDYVASGSKGTKMPRGDKNQIMAYPVKLPDSYSLSKFNATAIPILEMQEKSLQEIQVLTSLRDYLLPLLINGQISI